MGQSEFDGRVLRSIAQTNAQFLHGAVGKDELFMHWLKKLRWLTPALLVALLVVLSACNDDDEAASGEIGSPALDRPIVFAEQSHDSFLVLNAVARFIAEEGYGYETDSIHAETIAMFQGLTQGDMDIAMEIWVDQMPDWDEAVEDGTLLDLGTAFGESVQGWFVPTYVIEGDDDRGIDPVAPGLSHVDDLANYWEVFQDPEDSSKGRFYDCIAGWECERVHEAKFQAYGLDDYYNRFLPGSGPALATSLVTAYDRGEPWFGYYWGPTWIFGQLDLTMIEEPEYTEECWASLLEAVEAEEVPEQSCAYPAVPVHIAVHYEFAEEAPEIIEFLEQIDLTMDEVSEILLYMYENDVDGEEGAMWFLREREDLWADWVPDEVRDRVQGALD
jgi:glycine betaine/proline transport system substrate-binding protein